MLIKVKIEKIMFYFLCFLVPLFIYLRDLQDIYINKFLFIILIFSILYLFFNIENILSFFCYLIPFFTGIPSNYIIFIMLILIIIKQRKIINIKSLFFIFFILAVELFNIISAINYISEFIIYASYYFVIAIILGIPPRNINNEKNILLFSIGTVISMFIILFNSLTIIDFKDFFQSGYRFGNVLDLKLNNINMILTHDQNFIGYLIIISIASLLLLYNIKKQKNKKEKVFLIILISLLLFFGLLTISRAFILALLLLILLYIINALLFIKGKKKFSSLFLIFLSVFIGVWLINQLAPQLIENFSNRFSNEDTLGGRDSINKFYLQLFLQKPRVFFIGTGALSLLQVSGYVSTIHNATLQILVSYGVIGTTFFIGWYIYLLKNEIQQKNRIYFKFIIPHLMGIFIIQSIPFINPYYGMLPLIISVFAFRLDNN